MYYGRNYFNVHVRFLKLSLYSIPSYMFKEKYQNDESQAEPAEHIPILSVKGIGFDERNPAAIGPWFIHRRHIPQYFASRGDIR